MAKSKSIAGRTLMVFLGGKAIALSTSHTLTVTSEFSETSTKDDGLYSGKSLSKVSFTGSCDALFAAQGNTSENTYKTLLTAMQAGAELEMVFGVPTNVDPKGLPDDGWTAPTGGYLKGNVVITSLNINAPKDGDASFSVNFESAGALTVAE